MSIKQPLVSLSLIFLSAIIIPIVGARTFQDPQQAAPDNTKTNQRDRDKSSPTADQQKGNENDNE